MLVLLLSSTVTCAPCARLSGRSDGFLFSVHLHPGVGTWGGACPILLVFNQTIAAMIRNRDELGDYVAVEVPAGSPQVEHHPGTTNQWTPRGGVLRCVIEDDGGEDGSLPVIYVDDQEFTWEEFGRMLGTYAGWGMRIVFVPDDELEQPPKTVVRERET